MTERKLDIFRVLKNADLKNVDFFGKLTEEEQKAFQPFLVARWLSGTYSARQIYFINEIVNSLVFSLPNHKQLLWQLLTICTSGKQQRYIWNKLPSKVSTARPFSTKVVADYYQYSLKKASDAIKCLKGQDILDMADTLGLQPDEITKIEKEYKDELPKSKRRKAKKEKQAPNDLLEF